MTRSELIRRLVLNSICDDYENVDQIIFPGVLRDAARFGLTVTRPEILDALSELVADDLAKAWLLSTEPPSGLEGMPPSDVVDDEFTHFYNTKKGMEFHLADDRWWPFDD
jgi:hypothetical protein